MMLYESPCIFRSSCRIATFAFLAMIFVVSAVAAGKRKTRKVLYIGIDGCRLDALLEADAPNLKRLTADGAFSVEES